MGFAQAHRRLGRCAHDYANVLADISMLLQADGQIDERAVFRGRAQKAGMISGIESGRRDSDFRNQFARLQRRGVIVNDEVFEFESAVASGAAEDDFGIERD